MTSKYASRQFWIDTADRAVSTTAQAAIGAGLATATGLIGIDWLQVASIAGLAGAVSTLQSIAFRGRGDEPQPLP
ncbi:MAG TPA: holin [Solirubrobacter sp.]|nr:holin [Solirubrobacter sp.]